MEIAKRVKRIGNEVAIISRETEVKFEKIISHYEKSALRLNKKEEKLVYSRENDMKITQVMKKIIDDVLTGKAKEKMPRYFISPSWRRINERTGNYFVIKEVLRRRSNQSTWSRLKECSLT